MGYWASGIVLSISYIHCYLTYISTPKSRPHHYLHFTNMENKSQADDITWPRWNGKSEGFFLKVIGRLKAEEWCELTYIFKGHADYYKASRL